MGIASVLPHGLKQQIKRVLPGCARYYCPVCRSYESRFSTAGLVPRPNAECPNCGSRERHRLLWAYIEEQSGILSGRPCRMLHFAPEDSFANRLSHVPSVEYVTTDLMATNVDLQADITDLPIPDASFDVVLCSHVLEHIPDDNRAIAECYRVLKPGGLAIVMVPITADQTHEDPSITEPDERLRHYGQEDHVRRYGPDFLQRLEAAGFAVTARSATDILGPRAARYAAPLTEGPVYECRRPIP